MHWQLAVILIQMECNFETIQLYICFIICFLYSLPEISVSEFLYEIDFVQGEKKD